MPALAQGPELPVLGRSSAAAISAALCALLLAMTHGLHCRRPFPFPRSSALCGAARSPPHSLDLQRTSPIGAPEGAAAEGGGTPPRRSPVVKKRVARDVAPRRCEGLAAPAQDLGTRRSAVSARRRHQRHAPPHRRRRSAPSAAGSACSPAPACRCRSAAGVPGTRGRSLGTRGVCRPSKPATCSPRWAPRPCGRPSSAISTNRGVAVENTVMPASRLRMAWV